LHFLLRRKLLFRCRPAVGDQAATGSLDLLFESRCRAKKKDTQWVSLFLCLVNTIDTNYSKPIFFLISFSFSVCFGLRKSRSVVH